MSSTIVPALVDSRPKLYTDSVAVLDWLRKLGRRDAPPLRGAPEVKRHKAYSAESGYVYTYYYAGYREAEQDYEFVFEVSAGGEAFFPVTVSLPHGSLESIPREFNQTERYAIAKLALFQAFDDRADPKLMKRPVMVRPADAKAILETLGFD